MKYIITESQELKLHVLRRIDGDWKWITEIVDEGLSMYDPCDFKTEEKYIELICNDSSRTYLYSHYDSENQNGFKILFDYVANLIRERMSDDIIEHYRFKKEDIEC